MARTASVRGADRSALLNVLDQLAEGVVITDTAGRTRYANEAYLRMVASSPEEVMGKDHLLFRDEGLAEPCQRPRECLARGQVWRGLVSGRRTDGKEFSHHIVALPLQDGVGQPVGYASIYSDVTDRFQMQEQVRLAQRMETLGRLAGSVAHDFNNLITVILGASEIVGARFAPDQSGLEETRVIIRAAERARELIRGLLAFARPRERQDAVIDLNSMILEMQPMLRRLIRESIEVRLALCSQAATVVADRGQMEQVILNLCANANDAIPDTGIITISTEHVAITEAFLATHPWGRPGRYVRIAVQDTGIGMDQDTLGRVFRPFFTTKLAAGGTGLGLATVYTIVKQHKGMVDATSALGGGSSLFVYLPPTEERIQEIECDLHDEKTRGGQESILVVEDQPELRWILQKTLSFLGYQVTVARNGREALEILGSSRAPVQLVITDVVMPQMGGRELRSRAMSLSPQTHFLYMSGYEHGIEQADLIDERVGGALTKPFKLGELARRVREVLDRVSAPPPGQAQPGEAPK
ncbi:MAG: ATP-binding protein [Acidobacteriota bacterium]